MKLNKSYANKIFFNNCFFYWEKRKHDLEELDNYATKYTYTYQINFLLFLINVEGVSALGGMKGGSEPLSQSSGGPGQDLTVPVVELTPGCRTTGPAVFDDDFLGAEWMNH